MASDGSVTIDINVNGKQATVTLDDFKQKLNSLDVPAQKVDTGIKNIVASLGLMKVASLAVNTLKSSLDGAIARYDTLNNYPKVMESLGYSAEDAAKSTNKLKEGIQGLPTTLDSIVNNTQMLVSSMDDLDKATDLSLALNNMFLASGKGAEEANRAFVQFTQMLSKGKVDMQSWQTMMEVAPGQLNQIAKSMLGTEANARTLYSALQNGTVTFDQFVDQIIKANDGLGGFEEQARNATGGIATSLTNLKTAFKNGLENIIRAIDDWLEKNNMPKIAEMINELKVKIGDAFSFISNNIDSIMPAVIKIVDIIKSLSPALIAVGAGAAGIEIVISAMNRLKLAAEFIEAIPSKIGNIKNVFLDAGNSLSGIIGSIGTYIPYIAGVAAAVVVLAEAFKHLWETNEEFRNKFTEIWDGIKSKFESFAQGFVEKVNQLGFDFANITELMSAAWDAFCNLLAPVFEGVFNEIAIIFETVLDVISGILDVFVGLFTGNWEQMWNGIKDIFESLWNGIINFFNNALDSIIEICTKIWDGIKSIFSGKAEEAKQYGEDTGRSYAEGISNSTQLVADAADKLAAEVAARFHHSTPDKGPMAGDDQWMPDMMRQFAKGIEDNITYVKTAAEKAAQAISGALGLDDQKTNIIKSILDIFDDMTSIKNVVSNAGSEIADAFLSSLFGGLSGAQLSSLKSIVGIASSLAEQALYPILSSSLEALALSGSAITNNKNSIVNVSFGNINWSGSNDIEKTMEMIGAITKHRGYRIG